MPERDSDLEPEEVERIVASIHHTPIATIVTDNRKADNPIIAANAAFARLTGYSAAEILGRNCRFLAGEGTEGEGRAALRDAIASGSPAVVELTNFRKDGSSFRNAVMIAPVRGRDGSVALFVGSQMEVGDGAGGLRKARARELVERLTRRQRQVLELLTAGYRNKEIGGRLGIDEKTVKMHRARMLEVLEARASSEAIRIAIEADLTDQ